MRDNFRDILQNSLSQDFLTPLHISSHCNNVAVAEVLMKHGGNINLRAMVKPESPNGHTKLIQHCLIQNGLIALHIAAKHDHVEFVNMLMTNACLIDTQTEVSQIPVAMAHRVQCNIYENLY